MHDIMSHVKAEYSRQVREAVQPSQAVSGDRQYPAALTLETNRSSALSSITPEDDYDYVDDDFGEFESAKHPEDSWVHIDIPRPEDCDLADSPTPSPVPRGYLRSSQKIEHHYRPLSLYPERSDRNSLLSLEFSTSIDPETSHPSLPQVRQDTSTQQPTSKISGLFAHPAPKWAAGKEAFAKLGISEKAKEVTTGWKAGFGNKEQGELLQAVERTRRIPMVVETGPPISRTRDASLRIQMAREARGKSVKGSAKLVHLPPGWIEAEREAWNQ